MKEAAKFIKDHVVDIALSCLLIAIVVLLVNLLQDYQALRTKVAEISSHGYAHKQVVVAPNLPCGNCGNTIYQAQDVGDREFKAFICCLCGVNRVLVKAKDTILLTSLLRIFKQDYRKFKMQKHLNYVDAEFVDGHAYYFLPEGK